MIYLYTLDHDISVYTKVIEILACHYWMMYRICAVLTQPRKQVLKHAGHTAPTQQHELDHTDQQYLHHDLSIYRSPVRGVKPSQT